MPFITLKGGILMKNINNEMLQYRNNIITVINRMMYEKGWTIRQLSEYSDLPYESVKKLLSSKITNPSIYTLIKISNALGCSLDFLVNSTFHPNIDAIALTTRTQTLLDELSEYRTYLSRYIDDYTKSIFHDK